MRSSPAAETAASLGLQVIETDDVNAAHADSPIAARGAVGLVCAFGQIFREPLLSDLLLLNVHPSDLPRWRGAAPIERALMAGDVRTAVCIIRLEAGLDSGPIAARKQVDISDKDDFARLSERLAEVAIALSVTTIDQAEAGKITFTPQSEQGVTYAEKIDRAERILSPDRSAEELARKVRALTPHIGASLDLGQGGRLGVTRAAALAGVRAGAVAGELSSDGEAIELECSPGILRIDRVKPAGGKEMAASEFLRGHELPGSVPA